MDLPSHQLTMTVLMTPDMANFAGNVHGGTILKLLDQVAYACGSRYAGQYVVTLSVALKKPIEARIKRLDEQIAKLNARKGEIDARLASPDIYDAANKEELKTLITDQAYCSKELDQLENEWLEQQEALEQLQA